MPEDEITLAEASRISGVSESTLKRWASEKVIPVRRGRWTTAAAAQARVVARMRERGHSLDELRRAVREGRLAFGFVEDLIPGARDKPVSRAEAARQSGLEEELIERVMTLLGTPTALEGTLNEQDVDAIKQLADVLGAGFPLVALLQLVRVYAQSIRKIAEAEVRLFHLHVHEPMMRRGVPGLEIAEQMSGLARRLLPLASPIMDYVHQRNLAHFIEQDVIGHMEGDGGAGLDLGRLRVAIAFADLAGYTRLTEEEGDEEAVGVVERFVAAVEATLPDDARVNKTIGDEVMIVGGDGGALTDWAVAFQARYEQRPRPRIGVHVGACVYRDGDYYGREVNLAARVAARAGGGEVLVTRPVVEAAGGALAFRRIGEVRLKGFADPTELFLAAPGDG